MSSKYWGEAVVTALYLENQLPCKTIGMKTLFELWYARPPSHDHIRTFGCAAFVHIPHHKRQGKFGPTAVQGVLLGYCKGTRNYCVLDPVDLKIIVSHEVTFDEKSLPFLTTTLSGSDLEISELFDDLDIPEVGPSAPSQLLVHSLGPAPSDPPLVPSSAPSSSNYKSARTSHSDVSNTSSNMASVNNLPSRDCRPPEQYGEYAQVAFLSNIIPPGEPLTSSQALASPDSHHWKAAMQQELRSLQDCKTWSLVPLPNGKHCIGGKWVFKLKYKRNGTINCFKAVFVAKGFSQIPGLDFGDTYAPTGRLGSLCLLIALATYHYWEFDQLDVVTAFLNGDLEEGIYMTPPQGLEGTENCVCRIHQILYGLRQAPNCWYHRLSTWLASIGFKISQDDPCLFFKRDPVLPCFLWIHVDDIAVFGNNIDWFKSSIKQEFRMVDHGPAQFLLAI